MANKIIFGVFSVRADEKQIQKWKMYSKLSGVSMTKIVTNAMTEYIEGHPLTGFKASIINKMDKMEDEHMTVREWIEEQAFKAIEFEEKRLDRQFAESDKQACVDNIVNESVDAWQAGDDPYADDDETRFWRDRVIDYCEEQAEKIVEYLGEKQDEYLAELEEKRLSELEE